MMVKAISLQYATNQGIHHKIECFKECILTLWKRKKNKESIQLRTSFVPNSWQCSRPGRMGL